MDHAKEMARIAYDALSEKKGIDIRILDISGISAIADYFIIATGNNTSQIQALVDNAEEKLHEAGYRMRQREGGGYSPWVLLDYSDIIIHIFDKENRSFYNLEHIWQDGREVTREEL